MIKWILIILGVIIGAVVIIGINLFTEVPFPVPTGQYAVGTHLFEILDENRMETLSEDYKGPRRLAVRVFYPGEKDIKGDYLPVNNPEVAKMFSKTYNFPQIGDDSVRLSNSIIDVSITGDTAFPVIIFSHGGFSYSGQNLSTFEELASRGYIVFTLSHTYEALVSLFPGDEVVYIGDTSSLQETMNVDETVIDDYKKSLELLQSPVSAEDKRKKLLHLGNTFYKSTIPYLTARVDDIRFLLKSLPELNGRNKYPFSGKLDLDRIGLFGHSLGGVSASYICGDEDTPVKAGINLDAPVFLVETGDLQIKRPFAFFYSTATSLMSGGTMDLTGINSYYSEQAEVDIYSLSFAETAHYNFSDFNLMPPFFRLTPMLGNIDGRRMTFLLNRSVTDFFDFTLKGKEGTFYESRVSPFDEVRVFTN